MQSKSLSKPTSLAIQDREKEPWPPLPQYMITASDMLDRRLYNIVAWVISPNAPTGSDGYVKLSIQKSTLSDRISK